MVAILLGFRHFAWVCASTALNCCIASATTNYKLQRHNYKLMQRAVIKDAADTKVLRMARGQKIPVKRVDFICTDHFERETQVELASSSGLVSLPWHRTPGIATFCFTSHGGWPRNQMSNPHVQSRCLIQMSNPCYCALPLRAACSPDPLVPVAAAPPVLKPQAGTFPVPKDHAKAPSFF